jgi:CRISPR-associated protein Cas2
MPVIIVLSDCPPKLRGDMTKWFFEINTGVYVGNISARVRESLWTRITENIGRGHATMVFGASGEQHMDFRVHNAYWEPLDFDGIKLMFRPERQNVSEHPTKQPGFSNASKYRRAAKYVNTLHEYAAFFVPSYVVLDFKTTGLNESTDEIIEIGAILVERGNVLDRMQTLVQCNCTIPAEITQLTGISKDILSELGVPLDNAIRQLLDLAEDLPFVCHNALFEQQFLRRACLNLKLESEINNKFLDTLKIAQCLLPDLESYNLSALIEHFGIACSNLHRALDDCEMKHEVYIKLKECSFAKQ